MRMKPWIVALLLGAGTLSACSDAANDTYTLYRNSLIMDARIHMATFDAADGREYNRENCELVASLLTRQPGVSANYWCELGRYRE